MSDFSELSGESVHKIIFDFGMKCCVLDPILMKLLTDAVEFAHYKFIQ